MRIPMYQVDAFSSRPFGGNPAAVCPLPYWLPDDVMQAIAAENNLAETAFVVREGGQYGLRWFTPAVEVDLCGHATLASAYVILRHLEPEAAEIHFQTRSGELVVVRDGERLTMDFPARPPEFCEPHPLLESSLGGEPESVMAARDYLVVYRTEKELGGLRPNYDQLAGVERFGVIATAPGDEADYVYRFFAPAQGIPEDPVTGSAQCTLTPYWAKRLGKTDLHSFQISSRRGEIWTQDCGERVKISGSVAPFFEGVIAL